MPGDPFFASTSAKANGALKKNGPRRKREPPFYRMMALISCPSAIPRNSTWLSPF